MKGILNMSNMEDKLQKDKDEAAAQLGVADQEKGAATVAKNGNNRMKNRAAFYYLAKKALAWFC